MNSTEPSGLWIGETTAAPPQVAQFRSRNRAENRRAWRTDSAARCSRNQIPIRNRGPLNEPRSAAVPAASCGGVSPPARTPGETPGELAGEDARATFAGQFTVPTRDLEIVETLSLHEPALTEG